MKFLKMIALLMAVCLLGSAMMACDSNEPQETETEAKSNETTITVTLKIQAPKGSKGEDIEVEVEHKGETHTLGNIIEWYCEVLNEDPADDQPFDGTTLKRIGSWTPGSGELWIGYFEGEGGGRANEIGSLYNQEVKDHDTVVLLIDKI